MSWIALWALSAVAQAAPLEDPAATSLTVVAPPGTCDTATLDAAGAAPDAAGRYVFAPALADARELVFECGGRYAFHLSPGDDLTVHLDGGDITFEGRGAVANRYLATPPALATPRFLAQVTTPWESFAPAWAAARAADDARLDALGDAVPADFIARERARTAYRWALGQVLFPYMHWRETEVPRPTPEGGPDTRLGDVPAEAPEWSALPEYQAFLDAYVHEQARVRMAGDPSLRSGDHRWLRAELAVVAEFATPALRQAMATRLLEKHVEDDGADDIDAAWQQYLALDPPPADVERLGRAIAADRTHRDGHRIDVYRTVDGAPLEIHVLPPTGDTRGDAPAPAMLWLHGGSGAEGAWWHCPIFCKALRERGVTVLAVEMRTGNRFDAGPLESLDDAAAAWRWAVAHATDLGIDGERVGVAGFSSGATLALILATRGVDATDAEPLAYPAAVIAMGACADPAGAGEDGWFRRRVAERGAPADYSPIDRVRAGQPPLLAVHAGDDEYCSPARMRTFVERYTAAGNDATLASVAGVGHFFPFYFPPGVEQVRGALAEALRAWDWEVAGGSRKLPRQVGR